MKTIYFPFLLLCVIGLSIGSASAQVELTKTYKDAKDGFSFKYPKGWVEKREFVARIAVSDSPVDDEPSTGLYIFVQAKIPNLMKTTQTDFERQFSKFVTNFESKQFKKDIFGGKECLFLHYTHDESGLKTETKVYSFNHGSKNLVITFNDLQENGKKNKPVFDAIVSSFQFDTVAERTTEVSTGSASAQVKLTKTYKDVADGFSFKYPESWIEKEGSDGMRVEVYGGPDDEPSPVMSIIVGTKMPTLMKMTQTDFEGIYSELVINFESKQFKKLVIGGKDCVFLHYTHDVRGLKSEMMLYCLNHGSKNLTILFGDLQGNAEKNKPIFDAIANSFQFDTVAERTKTYTDPTYGFSFEYPESWVEKREFEGMRVAVFGSPVDGFSPDLCIFVQAKIPNLMKTTQTDFERGLSMSIPNLESKQLECKQFKKDVFGGKDCLFLHYTYDEKGKKIEMKQYFFNHGSKNLAITFNDLQENGKKNKLIFDAMASSFQFDTVAELDTEESIDSDSAQGDFVKDAVSSVELTKTYKDAKDGFSFKYPKGWVERKLEGTRVAVFGSPVDGFPPRMNIVVSAKKPDLMKMTDLEGLFSKLLTNFESKQFKTYVFGGKDCLFLHYTYDENGQKMEMKQYFFNHGAKHLAIMFCDIPENVEKSKPVFDAIVGSFQFDTVVELDKTYYDVTDRFSFDYPESWVERRESEGTRVAVFGSPVDGFSPNMNIMVEPKKLNLKKITKTDLERQLSKSSTNFESKQFKKQTFGGKDCVFLHYTHDVEGQKIEVKQYGFNHGSKGLVITFSDLPENGEKSNPVFDAIANSFQFDTSSDFVAADAHIAADAHNGSKVALTKTYNDATDGFSFKYPESWVEMRESGGMRVAVFGGPVDKPSPHMSVAVEAQKPDLMKMTKNDFERIFSKLFTNFELKQFKKLAFGGKDSVFLHYTCDAEGQKVEIKQYFINHGSKGLTIVFGDLQKNGEKSQPAFDAILNSFEFQ